MQFGPGTKEGDWQAVPPTIAVAGGVQGLMEVSNEVNQKHQGLSPFSVSAVPGPEAFHLLMNSLGDASSLRRTKAIQVITRRIKRDLNKVPGSRFSSLISDVIGPG